MGERLLTTFKRHNDLLEGACGGNMDCGTCHVLVDDDWVARLPPPSGSVRVGGRRHNVCERLIGGLSPCIPTSSRERGGPAGFAASEHSQVTYILSPLPTRSQTPRALNPRTRAQTPHTRSNPAPLHATKRNSTHPWIAPCCCASSSRLACQIHITPAVAGLTVAVPVPP